ncbi:MAG: hypothetical protein AAGD38_05615 [Acidobacteriota bacterium]
MDHILGPTGSLLDYAAAVEWEHRLDLTMDRVEDALFDYPAAAFQWTTEQLPELFDVFPNRVTLVHRLRAEALQATAMGLTGALEEGETKLAKVLEHSRQTSEIPQDLYGWMHAKHASMLIRLDRPDDALESTDRGFEQLHKKTPAVQAVRAQLQMCVAWLTRLRRDWLNARDQYRSAYDMVNHRKRVPGGYYRRGDITKTAAFLNLVNMTAQLAPSATEQLAYLARQAIAPRHDIRSEWGFAPYHEVITSSFIGRLQMQAGTLSPAKANMEFAARGFLKLHMPIEALEAALDLAALEPSHQTVERVFRTIVRDQQLSPRLVDLIRRGAVDEASAIRQEIASLREKRGQARVAA